MAEEHAITRQDVDELAGRLEDWAKTLPEQDQLVLGWVLARAAAADVGGDEVSGYLLSPMTPFPTQMQQAAGFPGPAMGAAKGGNTISVSWGRSFGGLI